MNEDERKAAILIELRNGSTFNAACREIGVTPKIIYRYIERDAAFAAEVQAARHREALVRATRVKEKRQQAVATGEISKRRAALLNAQTDASVVAMYPKPPGALIASIAKQRSNHNGTKEPAERAADTPAKELSRNERGKSAG